VLSVSSVVKKEAKMIDYTKTIAESNNFILPEWKGTEMNLKTFVFALGFISLLCFFSAGCRSGGSSGSAMVISPMDRAAIVDRINRFGRVMREGNLDVALSCLSPGLAASLEEQEDIIGIIPISDFGTSISDPTGSVDYLFMVPGDGIYQPSHDYAEVFAFHVTPAGNRIELVFMMVKEDGDWYIDDIKLSARSTGEFNMKEYFPLNVGDYWKYREVEFPSERRLPWLVVVRVVSGPEIIDGKQVFTIEETFEPVEGEDPDPSEFRSGRFTPFAGYGRRWRYSNDDGIWSFGPPFGASSGEYLFNHGNPWQITTRSMKIGSRLSGKLTEEFKGEVFTANVETELRGEPWNLSSRVGMIDVLPLRSFVYYSSESFPPGRASYFYRNWDLKSGLGIVNYREDTPGQPWHVFGFLVEAGIDGRVYNSIDWPFRILTPSLLPDSVVGEPIQIQLEAMFGFPPYNWELISGVLPEGLTLSPEGILSGAPAQTGKYSFLDKSYPTE
jgi:hypothetical protein